MIIRIVAVAVAILNRRRMIANTGMYRFRATQATIVINIASVGGGASSFGKRRTVGAID